MQVFWSIQQIRKGANEAFDRIYACVYGHCAGDAIGLLTETLSKSDARKVYYNIFIFLSVGQYSAVLFIFSC